MALTSIDDLEKKVLSAEKASKNAISISLLSKQLQAYKTRLEEIKAANYSEPEERRDWAKDIKEKLLAIQKRLQSSQPLSNPLDDENISQARKRLTVEALSCLAACDNFINAMIAPTTPSSPLSSPDEAQQAFNGFSLLTQQYKVKKSYSDIRNGKKYEPTGIKKTWQNTLKQSNPINFLSKRNLSTLKSKLQQQGGDLAFGLKADEKDLFQLLLNLPFKIQHATNHFANIGHAGRLDSLTEITRQREYQSPFSTKGNLQALGNGGFIFYRVFIDGYNSETTRYGNTRIIGDLAYLRKCGWVSLHDQLYPFSTTNAKRTYVGKKILLTSKPVKNKSKQKSRKALYEGLQYTYRTAPLANFTQGKKEAQKNFGTDIATKTETISFSDEIFFGEDILPGIALSVIYRLRQLDECGYRKYFLKELKQANSLQAKRKLINELMMKFYRIEAKYPVSMQLEYDARQNQYYFLPIAGTDHFSRKDAKITVINPEGDGRFNLDMSVNADNFKMALIEEELYKLEGQISNARRLAKRIDNKTNKDALEQLLTKQQAIVIKKNEYLELKQTAITEICQAVEADDDEELQNYPLERLEVISRHFICLLEAENVSLSALLKVPFPKLINIAEPNLIDYLENEVISFNALAKLSLKQLKTLQDYDIAVALDYRDYSIEEILHILIHDKSKLEYMCSYDLNELVLDYAPDVPTDLLEYIDEVGEEIDYEFIMDSLCESEALLLQTRLGYFEEIEEDQDLEEQFSRLEL